MVVSINGGTPTWMVYFMENPNLKWIKTGGTPIDLPIKDGDFPWVFVCVPEGNQLHHPIKYHKISCWLLTPIGSSIP